jgi:hypothetical protein
LTANPEDVLASGLSGVTVNVGEKSSFSQPTSSGSDADFVRSPEKFPGSSQESTLKVAVRGCPHEVGFVNSGISGADEAHPPVASLSSLGSGSPEPTCRLG